MLQRVSESSTAHPFGLVARKNSSTIKSDRIEIATYFHFIYWLDTIRKGGHWSTRRKPLTMSCRKSHILKLQLQSRLKPSMVARWVSRCATPYDVCNASLPTTDLVNICSLLGTLPTAENPPHPASTCLEYNAPMFCVKNRYRHTQTHTSKHTHTQSPPPTHTKSPPPPPTHTHTPCRISGLIYIPSLFIIFCAKASQWKPADSEHIRT